MEIVKKTIRYLYIFFIIFAFKKEPEATQDSSITLTLNLLFIHYFRDYLFTNYRHHLVLDSGKTPYYHLDIKSHFYQALQKHVRH